MENENKFVGYEYRGVTVEHGMESVWTDGYKNFGWKLEKSNPTIVKHIWGPIRVMIAPLAIFSGSPFLKMVHDHESETKVDLLFKRDKDIERKAEINRLQHQFENSAKEITRLEESKNTVATIAAYVGGAIGTAFMAGSVFSYLAGMMQLSVILAVPGFAGWILPYLLYKAVKRKKTKKVDPLIEKQYDTIYETCKKANVPTKADYAYLEKRIQELEK